MTKANRLAMTTFAILAMLVGVSASADAAQCGSGASGFEGWKSQFAGEARAKGISAAGVSALMGTNYASATIAADRG